MTEEPDGLEGYEDLLDEELADAPDYIKVLVGIGNELAGTRIELMRLRRLKQRELEVRYEADPEVVTYDCGLCEKTLKGAKQARGHAVGDHHAPKTDWEEVFE